MSAPGQKQGQPRRPFYAHGFQGLQTERGGYVGSNHEVIIATFLLSVGEDTGARAHSTACCESCDLQEGVVDALVRRQTQATRGVTQRLGSCILTLSLAIELIGGQYGSLFQ